MIVFFICCFVVGLLVVGYVIDMQVVDVRKNTNPMKYEVSESLKNVMNGGPLPDKYRLLDLKSLKINYFVEQTSFGDIYLIKSHFVNKDPYIYDKDMWLVTTERVYKQNCGYIIPNTNMNYLQNANHTNKKSDTKLRYNTIIVDGCFTIPTGEKPLYGMVVAQVKYSHVNFVGDRYAMMPFQLNDDTKIKNGEKIAEFNKFYN